MNLNWTVDRTKISKQSFSFFNNRDNNLDLLSRWRAILNRTLTIWEPSGSLQNSLHRKARFPDILLVLEQAALKDFERRRCRPDSVTFGLSPSLLISTHTLSQFKPVLPCPAATTTNFTTTTLTNSCNPKPKANNAFKGGEVTPLKLFSTELDMARVSSFHVLNSDEPQSTSYFEFIYRPDPIEYRTVCGQWPSNLWPVSMAQTVACWLLSVQLRVRSWSTSVVSSLFRVNAQLEGGLASGWEVNPWAWMDKCLCRRHKLRLLRRWPFDCVNTSSNLTKGGVFFRARPRTLHGKLSRWVKSPGLFAFWHRYIAFRELAHTDKNILIFNL